MEKEKIIEKVKAKVRELYEEHPSYFKVCLDLTSAEIVDGSYFRTPEEFDNFISDNLWLVADSEWDRAEEILNQIRENYSEIDLFFEDEENEDIKNELIREFIMELVSSKFDSEKIAARVTICPYQFDNTNEEGQELVGWNFDHYRPFIYDGENLEFVPDAIQKLFESQGYSIEDLKIEEKVENSKFLKSFKREVLNFYGSSMFLAIMAKISFEDYLRILYKMDFVRYRNDKVFLKDVFKISTKEGICIGFIDPIHGSGSILEIELEKDWDLPVNDCNIFTMGRSNYGYTMDEVYGNLYLKEIKVEQKEDKNE